jgi:stage V sporulation protein D (sporulation-specific penicillin-binding protein)
MLLLCFGLIAGRLYYLQFMCSNDLAKKAMMQRQQNSLLIHRGAITDRKGLPLAIDTTRYDVFVHPELLKVSSDKASEELSQITKQPKEKMFRLLTAGYPVVTVARHIEREAADEIQSLNWPGIDITPRPFRHYPEGQLAAHLLGYVNMDTRGQGGVEQAQEGELKDTGDIMKPQLDGRGHTILIAKNSPTWDITPPLGRHVELTIDNYLQHLTERELNAMAAHSHAQRATAIITDPQNGEILAWANYPPYDPNNYAKYPYELTKNWSMIDVYQPGSTFKILTVSSALDVGTIKPDWSFYDSGVLKVGNRVVHNHEGGNGKTDLLHLFIHSSNVGAARIAMTMTPKQFHDKLKAFGVGRLTGIELPGESSGLLLNDTHWKAIDQATTGFGQGAIAVTPLQLVGAVGTVANDGVWVQPHVIRRMYDPRTGVTEKWTEPSRCAVITPTTAQLVRRLLADNIALGSQIAGKVPGYRVAGKTGTAQKVGQGHRGYLAGQTVASFIGFLPADNPQLLCLVVVDGPQTDGRWGNTIAGPVFNAVAVEAARYLGITPSESTQNSESVRSRAKTKTDLPPSVKYAAASAADASLTLGDAR